MTHLLRIGPFASALAASALALCACAPGQAPMAPELRADIPQDWARADAPSRPGATMLSRWWLRLDDPLLGRLVGEALDSSSSVASAQAALHQARALRDAAGAGLLPSLDASASAERGRSGGNSAGNSFRVGLDASWELDVFGARHSALAAGEAAAQASAAGLGAVQVSVAAEVALDYIALRSAQARLAIADANLGSQLELLQLVQWRLQAGLVSSLEAEQSRAAAEQTRAQLPALRTSIEQMVHALAVLTGRSVADLTAVLMAPAPVPLAPPGLALRVPADALRQRPDVRAAESQVVAAMARVSQARAQALPNFRLSGSLGLNALALSALASGAALASALVAGVSMPLFDGGAARAQVRVQQAGLDQAHAAYRSAVLTALREVEDALAALRGDRERLARLQQAADAAANAALMARQRYASGLVDFQVVLETQRTQLATQDGVATARADVTADHVRLYKALGGGWQPEDDASTSPAAVSIGTAPR